MEFKLNENQIMIRDLARDFAQDVLKDRVEEIEDRSKVGHFPEDIYQKMCDTGFLGIPFSEDYGGLDMGYDCLVLAWEELAKQSPSAACALHISVTPMEAVALYGTQEQKDYYLPRAIAGETKPAMAFTEPGTGSDPKQLLTTAKLEGDTWVINGVKR